MRKWGLGKKWGVGVLVWFGGFIVLTSLGREDAFMVLGMLWLMFFPLAYSLLVRKRKAMRVRCPNCNYEGFVTEKVKGSGGVELVLWLAMILPGLIYSIWRYSGEKLALCPDCTNPQTVRLGMDYID